MEKINHYFIYLVLFLLVFQYSSKAETTGGGFINREDSIVVSKSKPWSVRMANSFIYRHQDYNINYGNKTGWNYEQGLMLQALYKLYQKTKDEKYFNFIIKNLDRYITDNGKIKTYDYTKFRLDDIAPGKALLEIYKATKKEKFKTAADTLRKQLMYQPRTKEGGFWHKEIYPHQMWLDGLFMAEPFYADYAQTFGEAKDFNDIANQFILIYKHLLDPKTGLLYHGWDESREQKWADPKTGDSPNFWGRGMGWYEMALVDVLDYFPEKNPYRNELIIILQNTCKSLLDFRDKNTGLWFQILDKGAKGGNYLEASGSCMFVYAFAKGAQKGYLNKKFYKIAENSYKGILDNFIKVDKDGLMNILHTCEGAGLGGKPYRDGSFEYYVNVPQRTNDYKSIGPFILASIELNK